jgi:hypothetical protein
LVVVVVEDAWREVLEDVVATEDDEGLDVKRVRRTLAKAVGIWLLLDEDWYATVSAGRCVLLDVAIVVVVVMVAVEDGCLGGRCVVDGGGIGGGGRVGGICRRRGAREKWCEDII